MHNEIKIDKKDLEELLDILSKYPYQFYVYGSRVKGYSRRYSDVDICTLDNITSNEIYEIKEALEESNITIKVDLVSVDELSTEFFKAIQKDLVELEINRN